MTGDGYADSIRLVLVKPQRLAREPRAWLLVLSEDVGALIMEDPGSDQIVDRIARLKGWIELDEGVGPEQTGFKAALHVTTDLLVTNMDEAADVLGVVGH